MQPETLITKLDLSGYIEHFNSLLARPKPLFLNGDAALNFARINEICEANFDPPPPVAALDEVLQKLPKFATLHISEIFEISKILGYFGYLKRQKFGESFAAWLDKIAIPEPLAHLPRDFEPDGELKESADERLVAINRELALKKEQIATELRRLIYTKSIAPYLVDSQIHFVAGGEALLVRGGFNHALKGSVVGRSASGFFYIVPSAVERLKNEESALLDRKEIVIFEYCKKTSATLQKHLAFCRFINGAFDYADALIARCLLARGGDLEFVLTSDGTDIVLTDFCHPALTAPKPVSVEFSENVLLITGVNAGGKSMLLKSLLAAAFLARNLLPMKINAERSKIGRFGEFECVIEDPQNSRNDISTFAGRMVAFSRLFGKKRALVGVDEIELGTDFEEAASLYLVLIRELVRTGAKLIITTHHKRLAMLLAEDEGVGLLAALYDEKNSRPKFEFLKGLIGKSYAFETALRYGISAALVARAREAYGEGNENLNEVISKTLNLQTRLRRELKDAAKLREKLARTLATARDARQRELDEFAASKARLEREFYEASERARISIKETMLAQKQRDLNAAKALAAGARGVEFGGGFGVDFGADFGVVAGASVGGANSNLAGAGGGFGATGAGSGAGLAASLATGERVKYGKISAVVLRVVGGGSEAVLDAGGVQMRVPVGALRRMGGSGGGAGAGGNFGGGINLGASGGASGGANSNLPQAAPQPSSQAGETNVQAKPKHNPNSNLASAAIHSNFNQNSNLSETNAPQNKTSGANSNFAQNPAQNPAATHAKSGAKIRTNHAQNRAQRNHAATPAPKPAPKVEFHAPKPQNARMWLDLHGVRAQEAAERLDKFISDALLAGFDEVLIRHGMGAGVLARVVREFLAAHPRVKSFADADANNGGYGTTIAQL